MQQHETSAHADGLDADAAELACGGRTPAQVTERLDAAAASRDMNP